MDANFCVFIVEDDEQMALMLKDFIHSKFPSFQLKTFLTGESALASMHEKPNVVILDYFLNSREPDASNGIAILSKIRAIDKMTRVILLSSQEDPMVAANAIKMGAYDYITKNNSAFERIENILGHFQKHMHIDGEAINKKIAMIFTGVALLLAIVYLLFKFL